MSESFDEKYKRLVAEQEAEAEAERINQNIKVIEYAAIKLQHDDETESKIITESINEYAKEGWTLHSTQFLPTVAPTPSHAGSGDLLLIFQKAKQD